MEMFKREALFVAKASVICALAGLLIATVLTPSSVLLLHSIEGTACRFR